MPVVLMFPQLLSRDVGVSHTPVIATAMTGVASQLWRSTMTRRSSSAKARLAALALVLSLIGLGVPAEGAARVHHLPTGTVVGSAPAGDPSTTDDDDWPW